MKQQKRYDDQLKQQAIEMALEGSKSVAQIARDLDISANTLYGWVDKYRRSNPDKQRVKSAVEKPVDLEAENRKLKRELARAMEDVELLKKAAVDSTDHRNTLSIICCGVLNLNVFRGLLFNSLATSSSLSCEC